jgi:hypothetical protein
MKLSKIAVAVGLAVGATGAFAGVPLSAAGSGFTNSHHDWTRDAITTATSGANAGSLVSGASGGTTAKAFYTLSSSGAPVVVTDAASVAGLAYAPAAGVPVLGTIVGDATTLYQVQYTSTTAPVTTNTAGTSFGTVRIMLGQCTKCHTPHVAKTTRLLWNHTLNTGTYSWAPSTTTIAGTSYATFKGDTYTGPSAKCLSCHDGSIGGSDGVWFNDAFLAGDARGTKSTGIAQGTSVSKTHPIAMPYPFGNVANTYNSVTNGAALINSEWVGDPQAVGIRLFNDVGGNITAGATAGAVNIGIECTSCHDVHNGATTMNAEYLLRGNLEGQTDYICAKCHAK